MEHRGNCAAARRVPPLLRLSRELASQEGCCGRRCRCGPGWSCLGPTRCFLSARRADPARYARKGAGV
jgi:hypothetical protein